MAGWRKYLGILTLLWTVGGQAQTIVQGSAPVRAGNCADAREMAQNGSDGATRRNA